MPFSKEQRSRQRAEQFRQQIQEHVEDENNNELGDMKPCCVPSGCAEGELVNITDPDDVQKVVCNNPDCKNGVYMHKACFEIWEEDVLTYLRSSGRARSWSEKQRKQNLWTKKGYDLAWKACSCKCGKGHLRKDLEWLPPKPLEGEKKQRRRRKSSDKPGIGRSNSVPNGNGHVPCVPGNGNGHGGSNGNGGNGNCASGGGNGKSRHRHASTSSTDSKDGYSPPHSPGGHSNTSSVFSPQHSPRSSNNGGGLNPSVMIQEQQRERVRNASGGNQNKKQNDATQNQSGKNGMVYHGGNDNNNQRSAANYKHNNGHGKNKNGSNIQQQQLNYGYPNNINMWNGVNENGHPIEPPKVFHQSNQGANGGGDCGKNGFTGFLPRLDLSTFFQVLPAHKLNAYHIQMEEDNQESEEIRAFIFSTLSNYGVQSVSCSQCSRMLPVFDRYPLIDGTFYLTPVRYGESNLCINMPNGGADRNPQYLAAVCMQCLEGVQSIVCRICKSQWDGSHHQLGTLYSYDIFAASPCCPGRAGCKRCGKPVLDLTKGMHYFSEFSRSIRCPHCGIPDFHCVKPLSSYEVHANQQINVF